MDGVKKYRADWRHVVLTTEDDAQYVGIADYSSKCSAADVYYRAWKSTEEEMDAQRLRADTAEAELAQLKVRYGFLRKVTPYSFKKMQDASTTDGGDVIYFHADRFDAQIDAALSKEAENENHE